MKNNKEFIKKIISAKLMEYEAIKEIMPEPLENKINEIEYEIKDIIKECGIEILVNMNKSNKNDEENREKKNSKKINVNFN